MTKISFYRLTSAFRNSAAAGRSAAKFAPQYDMPGDTILICGQTSSCRDLVAEALASEAGRDARQSLRPHAQPRTNAQREDDTHASPVAQLEAFMLADIVILVIDARDPAHDGLPGLLIRHHLFRRSGLVIAVTALEQTEDGRAFFETLRKEIAAFCMDREMPPMVPLAGNLCDPTQGHDKLAFYPSWFAGQTLREVLEAEAARSMPWEERPFRLSVSAFDRSQPDGPSIEGVVYQGQIAVGEQVRILPGGMLSSVGGLMTLARKAEDGAGHAALRVTLSGPAACRPGLILVPADRPCEVTDQVEATIAWFDDAPLLPGRTYGFNLGGQSASASVTKVKQAVDLDTAHALAADNLGPSAAGVAHIALDTPLAFDVETNGLSCFHLTDPVAGHVIGLGRIQHALRRADNIHWQALTIDRRRRAAMKDQTPLVVWMTGLSGAGKSTIANLVEQKLAVAGRHTFLLDGDNVRHGLNRDLGFTEPERVENIRRVAEVARLMSDAGLIVLCAFISPFRSERQMARKLMGSGEFIEVHVKASVEIAEARDPKGLYRKARAGKLKNFTGIDSPYEEPEAAEVVLDTSVLSVQEAANLLVRHITDSLQRR